jgi:TIR domain
VPRRQANAELQYMGGIFINYRRGETAGEARALFNELRSTLGEDAVFMDVDNIALGRDFRQVLHDRLESVDVMLALIGADWLQIKDAAGRRRLDDANDFVRREIRAALERNIAVTPVLLQGAAMPAEADLPEDIRELAFRNGFELSHTRWSSDVHELLKRLGLLGPEPTMPHAPLHAARQESLRTESSPPPPAMVRSEPAALLPLPAAGSGAPRRSGPWLAIGALVLLVAVGAGFMLYRQAQEARVQQMLAQAEAERQKLKEAADQARSNAEAASAAAALAQRERERLEEQTKERAAAQEAKERAAAEQLAKQRAAEKAAQERAAAAQLAAQRAAADRAVRDQAAKEQAAKEQAAIELAAKEQALKEQAAKDLAARQQQQARESGDRSLSVEQAAKERRMADIARGKFSGSLTLSLGDFAEFRRIAVPQMSSRDAGPACGKWSEQVPPEGARAFRSVCLALPTYAAQYGLRLGVRPSSQDWMAYCKSRADGLTLPSDERTAYLSTCLRYR